MRPRNLREAVERARRDGGDVRPHVDELLDNFYRTDDAVLRSTMIEQEPRLLDRAFGDTFVGAVGEHLARRWGLAVPTWTEAEERFLDTETFHPDVPGYRRWLIAVTPSAFARRNILTGPEPLHRLGFPGPTRSVELVSDEDWPEDGGPSIPPAYREAATRRGRRDRTK